MDGEAVPRVHFGKNLLYTFCAFLTTCRVQRNNAEQRITAMRTNGWRSETVAALSKATVPVTDEAIQDTDREELARGQIAQLISARSKGHGMTQHFTEARKVLTVAPARMSAPGRSEWTDGVSLG